MTCPAANVSIAPLHTRMRIHSLDATILVLYLAGVTLFGARLRRGQSSLRDYFLGNRAVPWWALAASIVATETSTLTLIGTPAIAYAGNLNFLQLVMGYLVARVVLCFTLLPQYYRGEFITVYGWLATRFGPRLRRVAAAVFMVTRMLAEGVRIAAIGKVVSVMLGIAAPISIAVIMLLVLFYTWEGGMKAVIWTDTLQLGMALAGSVVAFAFLLHRIPGGWPEVTQTAAAAGGKLSVFNFHFSLRENYTFWSGILGGTFLTMASHGTDQTLVQRLLAARSERDGKIALLSSGVVILFQFTLLLVLGVMLYVFARHAPLIAPGGDADRIFPEFIVRYLPPGVAAWPLAAILAMAMSNASGSLNSLASSSIMDFGSRTAASGAFNSDRLGNPRRWTLVWGVVLGLLGLFHWGPVLEAGLTIASITYGGMLGVFLLALARRRISESSAIAALLFGLVSMLVIHFFTPLAWTWYVLTGTLLTYLAGSLLKLGTPAANPPGESDRIPA